MGQRRAEEGGNLPGRVRPCGLQQDAGTNIWIIIYHIMEVKVPFEIKDKHTKWGEDYHKIHA